MNYINVTNNVYVYCIALILFTQSSSLGISSSLKREVRFSKFDFHCYNKSIIVINETGIKQDRERQTLYIQGSLFTNLSKMFVNINLEKCKDYYIDCDTVLSYELSACAKQLDFKLSETEIRNTCQSGDFVYENITFDVNQFGILCGLGTPRWWERYWKVRIILYSPDKLPLLSTNAQFYFIEYRSRRRPRNY